MRLSKLTRKQMIAIGIAILVVIGVGGYFLLIKGARERYQAAVTDRDDAKAQTERVPALETEWERVRAEHARAEARLRACYAAKMPYISVKDPVAALGRLWVEYGDNGMGRVLGGWIRSTGNWGGTGQLPDVRTDPPTPDTKQVEVVLEKFGVATKSFPSLLAFLRATVNMPRLGAVRKVKINRAGDRPLRLAAEIPMSIYLWTQDFTGAAAPAPPPTEAADAGGTPSGAPAGGPSGAPAGAK